MSNRSIQLSEPLYQHLLSVALRESPILSELREHTARMPPARV